ncbi:HD domain-containing protein [Pontibacillus sp. ALD_SL1]|uniref:HD domain-containing protein n=1 Tax=Pontibacillus sp. ALD_SL1 TaxID=2777185 RepID=UPI001A970E71|nr:HD domain-containing protein [Pontibacillus sp. ALD_SL1]QST01100.1 HD domain-containing protein [Pontibacillus sp. ALD_SL1]
MRITDQIYGTAVVEGILEELINSSLVQRLKGIYQGGASVLVNDSWNVTRYEHSIGVMLLIRRLGGSLEEQIAGLLHDVSHTAFSHVIDFVIDNKEEDYHEEIYEQIIQHSEIPDILERHGYSALDLLGNDEQWTLLEQSAPDLCADRVDYTLRDMYQYGHIEKGEIDTFLTKLHVYKGKMYVADAECAEWFVEVYYKEVINFFMHPLNIFGYDRLARALKAALDKGVITLNDFQKTDREVLDLLHSCNEASVHMWLRQLRHSVSVIENDQEYDLHRKGKVRLIDPLIMSNGNLIRVSEQSEKVKLMGEEAYKKAMKGSFVKIIHV